MKEKNAVKQISVAPLAPKKCTNAGYLGQVYLEGMGLSHRLSVDEGEEVC
jgi:hypothetical protein